MRSIQRAVPLVVVATLLLCASAIARADEGAAKSPRPNVLFICVDDLKPNLGCFGDALAKSPNLDALASRSIVFERAYCNQAVCAPSRNSLLTGLRPQTLGIYDLGTNFRRSRPDAVTLPQWFMKHGWRTEALGKIFHVGHGNHEDPASWSVPHYKSNVVAYASPESKAEKGLTREEALFSNKSAQGLPRGAAYEAADVADDAYPDGAIANEAIERLRKASERPDEPFFLAVGFVKPHLPFCAPQKYWDLYDRDAFELAEIRKPPEGAPDYAPQFGGELRQYRGIPEQGPLDDDLQRTLIHGYYAAMSYMDAQLGRVVDELKRLGLDDETIVVVWGDHGWHLGDHGIWCKHTNYEQAARIPVMISRPGADGGRSGSMIETVDIYPTLCEIAGLSTPEGLDGRSFAPTLKEPNEPARDHVTHVYPRRKPNVGPVIGRAVRNERYRLVEWKAPGAEPETADLELYDYQADPLETVNVAGEHPQVVATLREMLYRQPEAKPQVTAAKAPQPSKPKPAKKPALKSTKEANAKAKTSNESAAPKLLSVKKIWDRAPHNAFTDLIRFDDRWFCVFREGQAHVSPDGALRVIESTDGETWKSAALIESKEADLRDAKLSILPDGRLALLGAGAMHDKSARSHQSYVWTSENGRDWSDAIEVGDPDFWLWRTAWHDGTAYGLGYSVSKERSVRLYASDDGTSYRTHVESLFEEGYPNESAIAFEGDRAYCLLRRDEAEKTGMLGTSTPPYREWEWKDLGTRIGGPSLLRLPDGRFVAAVRLYDGKVRTSLCWVDVENGKLTEFLALPSGGDTSYAGLAFRENVLWVSYYSSHEAKTSIYLAQVSIPASPSGSAR